MVKKGKPGGKKKQSKEVKDSLPEVDKEFYEIQIADLNRKLNRLREQCADLQANFDEAIANFKKLDEDRGDVIAFLKRSIQQKSEEISEINERNNALTKESFHKINDLQKTIDNMKLDFKERETQLLSEAKLLSGKLKSLEEFRLSREELYNKFAIQEESMVEQQENYKRIIYELEKDHLLSKTNLRKEMENKLVKLSTDLQKTTQIRVASTTQNLIKENIAINNELYLLIESWQEIHKENEELKEKLKDMEIDEKVTGEQLRITLNKNTTQSKVITRLAHEYARIIYIYEDSVQRQAQIRALESLVDKLKKEKESVEFLVQQLKHEIDELHEKITLLTSNFNRVQSHNSRLEMTIHEATIKIKEGIGLEKSEINEADKFAKKQSLLSAILDIFDQDFLFSSQPAEADASVASYTLQDWVNFPGYLD